MDIATALTGSLQLHFAQRYTFALSQDEGLKGEEREEGGFQHRRIFEFRNNETDIWR